MAQKISAKTVNNLPHWSLERLAGLPFEKKINTVVFQYNQNEWFHNFSQDSLTPFFPLLNSVQLSTFHVKKKTQQLMHQNTNVVFKHIQFQYFVNKRQW